MNLDSLLLALLAALLAAIPAIGWALTERSRANRAEARAFELQDAAVRLRVLEEQEEKNSSFLQAQAAAAIAEQVMKRADETFHNREQLAQARLEAQLKPVAETLAKFQEQVVAVEKTRAEETGGLKEQINQLLLASSATQAEARKLSAALRRGAGVQGRWGEQTLRNVLEMAGLQNRFDFDEQVSTSTAEGRLRPDVVVRMPGGGALVIDAKVSLTAFLEAQDASDDLSRDAAYLRHADSVRAHIRGLAGKAYQDALPDTADFVAMFIPGDGFLASALDRYPDLLNEAMNQKVVVVTPTSLFALCKAVAYGWRVEEQAKGAAEIAKAGRELYRRLSDMGGHVVGVGKALGSAVDKYNALVGSLETRVLTQARRFEEFAADHEGKEMPELKAIESNIRAVTKLTVEADDQEPGRLAALTAKGR